MYKVIKYFTDLLDNNHPYNAGDIFPRKNLVVSKERLAELSSENNKRGEPLIKEVKETPKKTTTKNVAKKTANK